MGKRVVCCNKFAPRPELGQPKHIHVSSSTESADGDHQEQSSVTSSDMDESNTWNSRQGKSFKIQSNYIHSSQQHEHVIKESHFQENLEILIKVENAGNSSSSDYSSPSELSNEGSLTRGIKGNRKAYSKLPKQFDPNLGLIPYLQPLQTSHKPRKYQKWNTAPYFLDILPPSSGCDLNNSILLLGGLNLHEPEDFTLASSILEFHLSSKTWRYYGNMVEPRCYHATCCADSFLYVTGGYSALQRRDGEMLAISSTDRLDMRTTTWKRCADMKTARASHTMVTIGKHLYVFGGRNSLGSLTASVEVYDPEKDMWMEITLLPRPSMGLSATCINNQVWIIGGIIDDKETTITSNVYTFTPSTYSWKHQEPLPCPHAFVSCVATEDAMWVVGGSHFSKETLVSCSCIIRLKLRSGRVRWEKIASLSAPTHSCCTILSGKELYVFGGVRSEDRKCTDSVEIFHTETKTLRKGVSLPAPITGASSISFGKPTSDTLKKHQETVHSKSHLSSKMETRSSESILHSLMQRRNDFQEQTSSSDSDVQESGVPKSSQAKSSKVQLHNICASQHVTTRHHLHESHEHCPECEKKATMWLRSFQTRQRSTKGSKHSDNYVSKSSEEDSPDIQSHDINPTQHFRHETTAGHLHENQKNCFDSQNKETDSTHYQRKAVHSSSSTDNSIDEHTQKKVELLPRYIQAKQMFMKDRNHSKNLSGYRQ